VTAIDMNEIIVLGTTDTVELAKKIARELVEEKEAACVNILPGISSIYRWEGKICEDNECLLVIKSSRSKFDLIKDRIKKLHTYTTPEIIAVPIEFGDDAYLNWLRLSIEEK